MKPPFIFPYLAKTQQVKHPVKAQSREELSKYMCDLHNEVNKYLGKPLFDCSKVCVCVCARVWCAWTVKGGRG